MRDSESSLVVLSSTRFIGQCARVVLSTSSFFVSLPFFDLRSISIDLHGSRIDFHRFRSISIDFDRFRSPSGLSIDGTRCRSTEIHGNRPPNRLRSIEIDRKSDRHHWQSIRHRLKSTEIDPRPRNPSSTRAQRDSGFALATSPE